MKTQIMERFILELTGHQLTEQEVADFENRHALTLPDDYRSFLIKTNGGMPLPLVLIRCPGVNVCVIKFYSLNDDYPYDLDHSCNSTDWETAYEHGYLQIARDPGGSSILISTRGSDGGYVYFLDREETLRPPGGLVKVAESFTGLINGLEPFGE
jgi:hypothetical protein